MEAIDFDFSKAISEIREQIRRCAENNDKIKPENIHVLDSQAFNSAKEDRINPNDVYVVIEMGQVTPNGYVTEIPVTLSIISRENEVASTEELFIEYCKTYNMTSSKSGAITLQLWSTPVGSESFLEIGAGLRTAFNVDGTLVMSHKDISDLTISYEGEPVFIIQSLFQYDTSTDPHAFTGTNGLMKSYVKAGIRSLSFTTYLIGSENSLAKKMSLAVLHNSPELRKKVTLEVGEFGESEKIDFVLTGISQPKTIGSLASVQLSFSEGGLD